MPGLTVYGITDACRSHQRGATVAFNIAGRDPRSVASALAESGINCWSGNYYALRLMERLGLEPDGAVRVGLAHYNTVGEIDHLLTALRSISGRK